MTNEQRYYYTDIKGNLYNLKTPITVTEATQSTNELTEITKEEYIQILQTYKRTTVNKSNKQ